VASTGGVNLQGSVRHETDGNHSAGTGAAGGWRVPAAAERADGNAVRPVCGVRVRPAGADRAVRRIVVVPDSALAVPAAGAATTTPASSSSATAAASAGARPRTGAGATADARWIR